MFNAFLFEVLPLGNEWIHPSYLPVIISMSKCRLSSSALVWQPAKKMENQLYSVWKLSCVKCRENTRVKKIKHFGFMMHISSYRNFCQSSEGENQTEQWHSRISAYSLNTPLRIHLSGLEYGHGIWHCLIVEVLANRVKFIQPSGHCTVIHCAHTFLPCVFRRLHEVIVQFELRKHMFPNHITGHFHLRSF